MFLTRSEYDIGVNTFSPEGRLFQVEYAMESIKKGSTAIGIRTDDGVILAAEKKFTSKLMIPKTIEKVVEIDKHIGCTTSGLTADSRTLIDRARAECQQHWFVYNERMSVESCALAVSELAIKFGDSESDIVMSRPFGIAMLFAGITVDPERYPDGRPELWHMDPSGTYTEFDAKAIGSGSEQAENDLQSEYANISSNDDAIKVALRILKQIMENALDASNVEVMQMTKENLFQMLTREEVQNHIQNLGN